MGVKDQALLEYLKDTKRFADLVNGTMFGGRQIIDPQYLTEIQRKKRLLLQNFSQKEAANVSEQPNAPSFLERERDILMLYEKQGEKCYIGCEGQTTADYCMPVRELTYDGIEYSDQLQRNKSLTNDKSAVARPLIAVFNEVLYLGETRWNSKHSIRNGKISSI